jgi:hypothetical protein
MLSAGYLCFEIILQTLAHEMVHEFILICHDCSKPDAELMVLHNDGHGELFGALFRDILLTMRSWHLEIRHIGRSDMAWRQPLTCKTFHRVYPKFLEDSGLWIWTPAGAFADKRYCELTTNTIFLFCNIASHFTVS